MIFEEKSRMIELIEFLNYHQDLYDRGTPQISDSEWDAAYLELKELETLGGYSLPNSPTQKIRYEVINELKNETVIDSEKWIEAQEALSNALIASGIKESDEASLFDKILTTIFKGMNISLNKVSAKIGL